VHLGPRFIHFFPPSGCPPTTLSPSSERWPSHGQMFLRHDEKGTVKQARIKTLPPAAWKTGMIRLPVVLPLSILHLVPCSSAELFSVRSNAERPHAGPLRPFTILNTSHSGTCP
jgi:hypothetical protein